jgi:hypothetical protein
VPRRNPEAENSRLDREVEGRREGDRFSVDSGRDGSARLDLSGRPERNPGVGRGALAYIGFDVLILWLGLLATDAHPAPDSPSSSWPT